MRPFSMEKAMAGPFGFTYPTRTGTPNSQTVLSDGEWSAPWEQQLASIPKTITVGGSAPTWTNVSLASNEAAGGYLQNELQNNWGYEWRPTGRLDGFGNPQDDLYIMTDRGTPSSTVANPEWEKLNNQYQGELQNRQQQQTAGQQAYNNMLGNYQANGVIGSDYTNPNFGLVTGNNDTGMPQPNNETWTSGVYDPTKQSGTYNPNMVNKTFWGL